MVRSTFRTGYCQRIIPYDSSATVRQDSGRERTNTGRIPVVLARLQSSVGEVVVLRTSYDVYYFVCIVILYDLLVCVRNDSGSTYPSLV